MTMMEVEGWVAQHATLDSRLQVSKYHFILSPSHAMMRWGAKLLRWSSIILIRLCIWVWNTQFGICFVSVLVYENYCLVNTLKKLTCLSTVGQREGTAKTDMVVRKTGSDPCPPGGIYINPEYSTERGIPNPNHPTTPAHSWICSKKHKNAECFYPSPST